MYSDNQCHLHFFQDRNNEDFMKQILYFSPGYIQRAAGQSYVMRLEFITTYCVQYNKYSIKIDEIKFCTAR